MSDFDWNAEAASLVERIEREQPPGVDRGVRAHGCPCVWIVWGCDDYGGDERARQEAYTLRATIEDQQARELAAVVSNSGRAWCVLCVANDRTDVECWLVDAWRVTFCRSR